MGGGGNVRIDSGQEISRTPCSDCDFLADVHGRLLDNMPALTHEHM